MNITETSPQSYEAGRLIGSLCGQLRKTNSALARRMQVEVGRASGRKLAHLEDAKKLAVEVTELLCRYEQVGLVYPELSQFWGTINHFEGRRDATVARFGFFETYLA